MRGHADHTGPGLAVETSVLVLLAGAWLWGIVTLGAHATAAQGASSGGEGSSGGAEVWCPAPRGPENEWARSALAGDACRLELRLHTGTSRQPGRSS